MLEKSGRKIILYKHIWFSSVHIYTHPPDAGVSLSLLSLGGHFYPKFKFKFRLFLNDLWYEPETLLLFLTFTRDYFAEKKIEKNIKLSGGKIFLYQGIVKK